MAIDLIILAIFLSLFLTVLVIRFNIHHHLLQPARRTPLIRPPTAPSSATTARAPPRHSPIMIPPEASENPNVARPASTRILAGRLEEERSEVEEENRRTWGSARGQGGRDRERDVEIGIWGPMGVSVHIERV
ncbi:MAG: hypothetical protein M1827_000662 [Pycnora praestabilis]|nr:MAG: hypothetical protein M1827_000662 [Pycnora praestabilis]